MLQHPHASDKHRSQVSQEILIFKNLAIHLKTTFKSSNSNEKSAWNGILLDWDGSSIRIKKIAPASVPKTNNHYCKKKKVTSSPF